MIFLWGDMLYILLLVSNKNVTLVQLRTEFPKYPLLQIKSPL